MKQNKRKRGLAYGAAHAVSLVILGILAVPFALCFGLLWTAVGLSDKLLDRLDKTADITAEKRGRQIL